MADDLQRHTKMEIIRICNLTARIVQKGSDAILNKLNPLHFL